MGKREKLTAEGARTKLAEIPGWKILGEKLHRELEFRDFVQAFSFMTRLALIAEKHDHHPELYNVYNRVTVNFHTHDVGGLSQMDFKLAAAVNQLLDDVKLPSE